MFTDYGIKENGLSPFVIIAPHAGGDDLKTSQIAKKLAEKLDGYLVINKNFIKPNNSRATNQPDKVENFNRLRWGYTHSKYLWKKKKPEMKKFFEDISEFCEKTKKENKVSKAVAVYIHGMYSTEIGIDIGVGAKKHNSSLNKIFGSKKHKETGMNSGAITIKIKQLKDIKKKLQEETKKSFNLKVSVGKFYSGWSKRSAVQFHKHEGRNDYAIQFEINHILRKPENIDYTVALLAQTLKEIFIKTL